MAAGVLSMSIPQGWQRGTITAFTNGVEGEGGASVVVRTESLDPRTSLGSYIDQVIVELARTLPSFSLLARDSTTIGGEPAQILEFIWVARGVSYLQTHTCALPCAGEVVCIVTSTSQDVAGEHKEVFEHVRSTLNFVKAEPAGY